MTPAFFERSSAQRNSARSNQLINSVLQPVPNPRPIAPALRRISHSGLKRPAAPAPLENGHSEPIPVLHCLPLQLRGRYLQFQPFDDVYLNLLRAGDFRTQEHFCAYFGVLIRIKASSRLRSPEMVEDVRQETFTRFFRALQDGKILQPERLGSFVNSICRNVLLEHYRSDARNVSLDCEDEESFPALNLNILGTLQSKETDKKVREILQKLPERDRRLLKEVFLDERDKDEVCRDFGVDREYLRVLLHRAKQAFKSSYLKHMGDQPPDFAPA